MSGLRVCLLLLSLLATILSCSAAPPPVYDTDGHELSTNASYYVLPAEIGYRPRGGGLTFAHHKLYRCPLFVSQDTKETGHGFPVKFTPYGGAASTAEDLTVRLSTDVRIRYDAITTCVQSTEWHVDNGELLMERRHVVTGPITNPRDSAFRIEKNSGPEVRHEYKLMSCQDKCEDIGVFKDGKGGPSLFLGVTEPVHVVVFKKAPSTF